jgi:catechol 2,3-dioxygenase-like lactoylglutathione lyase family enzyme
MRIVEARLPASDPDALTAWYAQHIGAAPTFVAGETSPHHFAFHVADLEPWKHRLDLTKEHDFSSWDGARAVYFGDPEGNVAELITRPDARPELTLAEVGLPVDDVPAAVEALRRALEIESYREESDAFAPLGDGDGLLIIVRVGRGWFPVDVPAGRSPIEVTLAGVGSGVVELPGSGHHVVGAG